MELAEAKKLAEEKRREKTEDRIARQKVKEQIARDRADRAEREANSNVPRPTGVQQHTATVEPKRDYTTCRLQVSHII